MKNIRYYFFWTLDAVHRGKVRKHYKEIKMLNENYGTAETKAIRRRRLNDILKYANSKIPYYTETGKIMMKLSDFPVINKSIIKEDFEKFLSPDYQKTSLRKMSTSGSTGTPFTIYQDKNKVARSSADFIYAYELADYSFGKRIYIFKSVNEHNKKSRLEYIRKNIIEKDTADLSKEGIQRFIKTLANSPSEKILTGYASSYTAIAQNTEKKDVKDINIHCIITGSESLPLVTKQKLKYLFECPVYSRYSNMENGFLAQQCDNDSEEFHLNVGSYYFEILSFDDDSHVKPGEKGRIVVTDLFNYAMPLIRYDTGDVAVYDNQSECGLKTPVFKSLEGRLRDFLFDTKGNMLSPSVISTMMWKYRELLQYQFIQEGEKDYTIKLNCKGEFEREFQLIDDITRHIGKDARIKIEYVSEIPLLDSGKRKYIVNNYKSI